MKSLESKTCVQAWLSTVKHLASQGKGWRDYNVTLEISDPLLLPQSEKRVVEIVDTFLRKNGGMPINTVVNTIFPAQLYARHGAVGVYERYLSEILPQIRKHPDCSWGTYAQRILYRAGPSGKEIFPLRDLISKLKSQLQMSGPNRAVYELGTIDLFSDVPIYEARDDRNRPLGGPCLSHLSFHLGENRQLMLTALYRSHWYVQRALGNLLGLAHLQHFVAAETGLRVGPLVCMSTMAVLDVQSGKWGKAAVRKLIEECDIAARDLSPVGISAPEGQQPVGAEV